MINSFLYSRRVEPSKTFPIVLVLCHPLCPSTLQGTVQFESGSPQSTSQFTQVLALTLSMYRAEEIALRTRRDSNSHL